MLVITRRPDEEIRIGDQVTVRIVAISGNRVRIGIDAPRNVAISRGELCQTHECERLAVATPAEAPSVRLESAI